MYSLIIPVYKNEDSINALLIAINDLNQKLDNKLEAIFVNDGSPDQSLALLEQGLKNVSFAASILVLSKNFGSFAAIRAGLEVATGPYFAVMAADLQEPPQLILDFFAVLKNEPYDVVVGTREKRDDPLMSRLLSRLFWGCYRRLVQKEVPAGGVDIFGCNLHFRDELLKLNESNSTLIGLLFWLGFRRKNISYTRLARIHGKSAWSLAKKIRYLSNSVFAFSDLPITLLFWLGFLCMFFSAIFALIVLTARVSGYISLPGYTPIIVLITFLFGFNAFSLALIGSYVWRTFENSKGRPQTVIILTRLFNREIS